MKVELDIFRELESQLKDLVISATKEALVLNQKQLKSKEWMSLKEGAAYAGVSYNSFIKFRLMGLPICEIDGIKRVSKYEIDTFLRKNSF
ncbi:hypothetical protein JOD29_001878 [Lysinibacillus composti]|uniref:DNA-binding protein n=1 Tax=Lysinibacillus composti TaxID=720633 RepID=A0A3N9UEB6_9BACI|nr:DNA-binding protein [Lysinibacillus composti]MBM7608631.1 hypothetical protein [Lysinibacillus composti]RQW74551.1 DNA-binding protein [Lysinibacillus composti]